MVTVILFVRQLFSEIEITKKIKNFNNNKFTFSYSSNADERSMRLRRTIPKDEFTETEHLFLGWAIMVSQLSNSRMIALQSDIGQMVREAELEEVEEELERKTLISDDSKVSESSKFDDSSVEGPPVPPPTFDEIYPARPQPYN